MPKLQILEDIRIHTVCNLGQISWDHLVSFHWNSHVQAKKNQKVDFIYLLLHITTIDLIDRPHYFPWNLGKTTISPVSTMVTTLLENRYCTFQISHWHPKRVLNFESVVSDIILSFYRSQQFWTLPKLFSSGPKHFWHGSDCEIQ